MFLIGIDNGFCDNDGEPRTPDMIELFIEGSAVMTPLHHPWIKLKEHIDQEDYVRINKLRELCLQEDQTALKLELDYKLASHPNPSQSASVQEINEFMHYDGELLIGYIGISGFGGSSLPIEVNGMVHPAYRRQGVFSKLWDLVTSEWKRRNASDMLLLSDRKSHAGQRFIEGTGAAYHHSEYEMDLNEERCASISKPLQDIAFRKATNADAREIARQNAVFFNDESEEISILPEEEEQRGMTIYLAEKDQQIVGKAHVQLASGTGGIYGLGVLPEHRGKGYGRAVLLMAVQKLLEAKASRIMLQVAADNSNALHLYKSCGFEETSTMDYYAIKRTT